MVGFFVVLLLIRTTGLGIVPSMLSQWDLLLPFMVYFGQRRPLFEGLMLWFFLAHIYSLQSVAPVGLFVVYYLIVFLISRLTSEFFYASSGLSVLGLIAILSFVSRLMLPLVAESFGSGWSILSWRNLHPGLLFTNCLCGWLCFMILALLDKVSGKDARQILDLQEGIV